MKGEYSSLKAGLRYGSLTVLKRPPELALKQHQNLCQCDCGKKLIVTSHMLATGKTTDCGCVIRNRVRNDMYPERIEGLDHLANAVIARAIADYRHAVMVNLKNGSIGELKELRKFFRSGWCTTLTEMDTKALMKCIEEECITEFERTKKRGYQNQVHKEHSAN